jgi:hypothetical protein
VAQPNARTAIRNAVPLYRPGVSEEPGVLKENFCPLIGAPPLVGGAALETDVLKDRAAACEPD